MYALQLEGSLRIEAHDLKAGKCTLKNVTVHNQGNEERCLISIARDGEFYAENILLRGDLHIIIEAGTRIVAFEREGEIIFEKERVQRD